jgi:uncharacterized membrane protein YcaP (DUF421 family)
MEAILRVTAMYMFLLIAFRFAGKRALSEATTFDLLLLLIISETTQQALVGDDHSVTHALLMITSFLALEVFLSALKVKSKGVDRVLEGTPLVLVDRGELDQEAMRKSHVDADDVLEAARATRGLERLEQIRYAILERNGKISIIPS